MSGSNCCFLTCIHVSQEIGKVVWYSHLFKNFPQFVVIHTITVNEAKVYIFLEFSCFFCYPTDVGNLISGSSAFLNPAWTSGSSRFTYCWSLTWTVLSVTLLACEMEKARAPHSSTLAWKIPWTVEPGGLPSMGSRRVGHDWNDFAAALRIISTLEIRKASSKGEFTSSHQWSPSISLA